MKKKMIKDMGVLYVMAHLVITLAILSAYTVFRLNGIDDEPLKMALFTIVGFWFGAIGKDTINEARKKDDKR